MHIVQFRHDSNNHLKNFDRQLFQHQNILLRNADIRHPWHQSNVHHAMSVRHLVNTQQTLCAKYRTRKTLMSYSIKTFVQSSNRNNTNISWKVSYSFCNSCSLRNTQKTRYINVMENEETLFRWIKIKDSLNKPKLLPISSPDDERGGPHSAFRNVVASTPSASGAYSKTFGYIQRLALLVFFGSSFLCKEVEIQQVISEFRFLYFLFPTNRVI